MSTVKNCIKVCYFLLATAVTFIRIALHNGLAIYIILYTYTVTCSISYSILYTEEPN